MNSNTSLSAAETLSAVNAPTLYADINNRAIAYRSIGKGQPIILCQRFRGNLDDWDPAFLDALAEKLQVIIFDYTGFGSSTGTPPSTVLEFAQDIKDLATFLGLKKIISGGWSLGAFVAQIALTEFPEIVSHGVMIGTKAPGKVTHPVEQIFLDTAWKPSYTVDDEAILFFEPASAMSREAAQKSHDRIAARKADTDIRIDESLWGNYESCAKDFEQDPYNAREKMMNTNIPILVITADHEVCFPPENWFELNRKLPTTQVIVFPQSGHGVQHQHPELVADYIKAFIERN